MSKYSLEHIIYLKKLKLNKILVFITQISIIILFFIIWEILARNNIINTFIYSSPTKIFKNIILLFKENTLFIHLYITLKEVILSFIISVILGFIISTILISNKFISKVFNPYLTIINSLPKVSLGPLIIIIFGSSIKSIIIMSLMISLFVTIIDLYNYFINTNPNYITLMKSYKASKYTIYKEVIIPSNKKNIIKVLKVNMSMNFIGTIMGELLVSKAGLGYLITYGSQIFNITLIFTSIILLSLLALLLYYPICYIEKKFL